MSIIRTRRALLTYDDHLRAAISAGIWAVVPVTLFFAVLGAFEGEWTSLFSLLNPVALMIIFFQVCVITACFLPTGWLVARALGRAGKWSWYPFSIACGGVLVLAISINWWFQNIVPQTWLYGVFVIFGAHAGWRYYVRLSDEKSSPA